MNVKLTKHNDPRVYDITQAVESIVWEGSGLSAGRSTEISFINAPYDHSVSLPQIATGDYISLEEGKELYFGQLFGIEKSSSTGTITYPSYDMMKNLLESTGRYNFKNIAPEEITRRVCGDIQIPIGELAQTGINIKSMLCNGTAYYDIIMGAYTQAYRMTGKKYFPMIWNRKMNVYEANWIVGNYVISDDMNLTSVSISETMDSIKNKVKIYDEKGNQIGEVKDDESIKTFGVFQEIYESESGVDPNAAARNLLKVKPDQSMTIEVIGDINCLSCYGVTVKDAATGLQGRYWILSDKHTWKDGIHTMELELSFDRLMDKKDIEAGEEKKV